MTADTKTERNKSFYNIKDTIQWLIEHHCSRSVVNKRGETIYLTLDENFQPRLVKSNGYPVERLDVCFPLTTFADEHGQIDVRSSIEKEVACIFSEGKLDALKALMDERIALATVAPREGTYIIGPNSAEFVTNVKSLQLKPKGK